MSNTYRGDERRAKLARNRRKARETATVLADLEAFTLSTIDWTEARLAR